MPTAKGSNASKRVARRQRQELWVDDGGGELYRRATIDVLPDDVLLEIFSFYVDSAYAAVDEWRTLVHVCRRWRHIVFASPHRLNLRLLCTRETPVKKFLDVWPKLPIAIDVIYLPRQRKGVTNTNIDAALKHKDRVCEIAIEDIPSPFLERFARMKEPFTALTYLRLWSNDKTAPVIPDSFSGGSAPRLRTLSLRGIPFPGLPKLLLSAHHLVNLSVSRIPHSGYISPETMATALSSLTSLSELTLAFRSSWPHPGPINTHPSALTRAVLPALTSLYFKGVSEYFQVLISQIDVPLLKDIDITFFDQLVFDVLLLRDFIRRTEAFKALHRAYISFSYNRVVVRFPLTNPQAYGKNLVLGISCRPLDRQLLSLVQVCNGSLPPFLTLEHLDILWNRSSEWQDDIENTQWLELLQPFIAVKDLHLDMNAATWVAPALQELAEERGTGVLPALQNIFIRSLESSGSVQEAIAQFVTARQLLGHPTTVRNWEDE